MPPANGNNGTPATFGENCSVARRADSTDRWPVRASDARATVPKRGEPLMKETICPHRRSRGVGSPIIRSGGVTGSASVAMEGCAARSRSAFSNSS